MEYASGTSVVLIIHGHKDESSSSFILHPSSFILS